MNNGTDEIIPEDDKEEIYTPRTTRKHSKSLEDLETKKDADKQDQFISIPEVKE